MTLTAEQTTRALGGHWHGSYGTARCPCHDDHHESLSITDGESTTLYKCFVGCTSAAIAKTVGQKLNGSGSSNGAARELMHPEFGKPLYRHDYLDPAGKLRFVVCRWEWPDRPKQIRPAIPTGDGWKWTLPRGPRPPYRLREAIAETECGILIVEGEKKADIASKLFLEWVLVGWSGGASAWDKTDWSLLPAGRKVVIWPDNDQPGIAAAHKIAARIPGAAVVDTTALGLPEAWDLGDPIPAGLEPEEIVRSAEPTNRNIPTESSDNLPVDTNLSEAERFETRETLSDPGPRFVLERFNTLTAPKDPYYAVKGILPARGLAVIWGPPKCGKSFWTFDLLMHIALKIPYRGRKVRGGPVVYIACEGGDWFGARIEAFRQCFLGEDADPPFFLIRGSLDLLRDHKRLAAEIAAVCPNPVAVAIDTVNTSFDGSEIDDMPAYTRAAKFVAEALKCVVPVVHHCGIAGERPRGHTSLTANCDAQIAVKKSESGLVTATVEFMKDGAADTVIQSRIRVVDLGTDADGDPIQSCVVDPADTETAATPKHPRQRLGKNLELALLILQDAGPDGLTQDEWNTRMAEAGLDGKQRQYATRLTLKNKKLAREYNGRWHVNKTT